MVIDGQIKKAFERLEGLYHGDLPSHELSVKLFSELEHALDELQTAAYELREQNRELIANRQILEEEHCRYQELFDFAPDGYLVTDTEGIIREANSAVANLLRVNGSFLIQKPLAMYVASDERLPLISRLAELNDSSPNQNASFELVMESTQRKPFPVSMMVAKVISSRGVTELRWMLRDITEQKQLETALRQSEEKYRTLFSAIAEGFAIIDILYDEKGRSVDWCFREANPAYTTHTGLVDIIGKRIRELVPDMEDYWYETVGRIAETGVPEHFERKSKPLNRWFDVYAFKIGPQTSRTIAIILRDITDQLRQADQNKTDFISVLSHELRNPLASIMMAIELQGRVIPDEKQDLHFREVMKRQSRQLTRLVDDLLDITRISQNKIHLKKELTELNELVQQVVSDYQIHFKEKEVGLLLELANCPVYLDVDSARITQVIGNLLHNAFKFTSKGDNVYVTLAKDQYGREVTVGVRDTGTGIHPKIMSNLFDAFVQADQEIDRSSGGLGLGLAIVKGIIDLHGGKITVTSEGPGKGSEFTIHLPLPENIVLQEQESSDDPIITRNLRVLIIDDIPDIADILASMLGLLGHAVITASNGPEGIEKARTFRPEVVICDIGLPQMDGFEVAETLRRDPVLNNLFLIAFSGYANQDDIDRAKAAGFDRHLAKPVDMMVLKQVLCEVPDVREIIR